MPKFPIGSRIQVSGVCFVESGGPWNTALWFELYMGSPGDVKVLALPPWWTVPRLLYVIGGLGVLIVAALIWGALLRRQVYRQTRALRRTMEEEAASQRRQAFLEKQRSSVLEAINSSMPLDQVLGMITDFISEQMHGRSCWCAIAGGRVVGSVSSNQVEPPAADIRQSCREILSSTGNQLGTIVLAEEDLRRETAEAGAEVLDIGASLAALAMDNRRLYDGLIHRSQYDQLTQMPNRFLLGTRVDEAIRNARLNGRQLALIYIDLDRFKDVNDRYGHRVGDVYLQHVARRLSEKLRGHDTLARVGGDEFIALISVVRDRVEADEIANRLGRCFDSPFSIDDHSIYGSASIGLSVYPEDGESEEDLNRVADSAMYADKQR
jgi:diguanylate cyclase (GGDEF)-like protein